MLQSLRFQFIQMAEYPHQFIVNDKPGWSAGRIHGDVATRIGSIGPVAPHLGQIEHLAQHGKRTVCIGGLV